MSREFEVKREIDLPAAPEDGTRTGRRDTERTDNLIALDKNICR